jgi:hypothetical protein
LDVSDQLKDHSGNSGPIVADWDGDGLEDLLVGMGDGSAHWFRNVGSHEKREFADGQTLVEKSAFGFRFEDRQPGQWGARVKLCATDFDGDGLLDLLLGDRSGSVISQELTEQQQQAVDKAGQRLSELRTELSEASARLRALKRESKPDERPETEEEPETEEDRQRSEAQAQKLQELQERLQQLTMEYNKCRATITELGPKKVRHGFVWFFRRQADRGPAVKAPSVPPPSTTTAPPPPPPPP